MKQLHTYNIGVKALGYAAGDYRGGFRNLRGLATNRDKVIIWRNANPCKEGNAQASIN